MVVMPFATTDIYADVDAAERERQSRIDTAWRAYRGDLPKPLKIKKFNDNVQPNFSKTVVNLGVTFLFGKQPTFEVTQDGEEEKLEQSPEEVWLEACWKKNDIGATLLKLSLNGGVCGHTFVKIKAKSPKTDPFPRLIILDPASICCEYDGDDIEDVYKFTQSWREINKQGKAVSRRQVIERAANGLYWTITDQEANADSPLGDAAWTTLTTEPWRYPFPPIEHCQNLPIPNEFWGLSDLESDLIDMQRAIDFLLSNLQKTVRLGGHPKPYVSGANSSDITADPDQIASLPTGAVLDYLQADPFQEPSIELYERLLSAFHEVAEVPEVATGKLENIGQLSGLALQILYGPLLAKTNMKRQLYGPMLQRINRALLALGGFGDDRETEIVWQDPLPQNSMEQRQVALLDQQLGVSKDTTLTNLGYDAEKEAEKRSEEAETAMEAAATAFDRGAGQITNGQPNNNRE